MPTIEVSYRDLCSLVGKRIPLEKLREEGILYAKGELDAIDGDTLKVDIKDTNRPDLWSTEGIAREIAGRHGKPGLPSYKVGKPRVTVDVDKKLRNIRPYTVCAVVRNLKITPDVLSQMIQLQEKVSLTFGRNRKEVAIGVYDLHKLKPPIRFTSVKPDGIKFIPLEFNRKLTPAQILQQHPKGKEFGHLLKGLKEYPIFIDSVGQVLSMPPIINSDWTGKVTESTRDVFIECSGFELRFLLPALNVVVTALADRGGLVESVRVNLPGSKLETPDLEPKKFSADPAYINRLSGLKLSPDRICRLLEQSRYKAVYRGKKIHVLYPAYRQDIMHQADIAEDAIISYGYNRINPEPIRLATTGSETRLENLSHTAAGLMTGLGCQEILSYTLTNKSHLFDAMALPEHPVVEVENPVSANWCMFRNWLLPSLIEFLSRNKHVDYPQKIFEIGDTVVLDPRAETKTTDKRKLAVALAGTGIGYENIRSMLDALLSNLGIKYTVSLARHRSFIPNRTASVTIGNEEIGVLGEIHPRVLANWGLEVPVAALELNISSILKHKK
jgi:phenylalanyl-tRNA synthetase beta chain